MIRTKLALGTAQFGMSYGVANSTGAVELSEIKKILLLANSSQINTLDTAIAYGNSEKQLGMAGVRNFNVITKLPSIPDDCLSVSNWVESKISESLEKLHIEKLHGLLLHRPEQLHGAFGRQLYQSLKDVKQKGIVENIGVSIYSPTELDLIFEHHQFDIVQTPFNIVDQRIVSSGWLAKLKKLGVKVHSRSAFLQGVLLMSRSKLPPYFDKWKPFLDKWHSWIAENKVSPVWACLMFVAMFPEIDNVIVGIETVVQLKEIIEEFARNKPVTFPDIQCDDVELINPSMWSFL